jgi:ryanodine receptor 2
LPVSAKIAEITRSLYHREITIRTTTRNADSTDRESIESDLQRDYEVLIRNIYAFYPLLIKYVDMHRAYWLKNPDEHSEKLYSHIAEVFNLWLKSKMFKREEINFVSSNDIDNMLLIMPNKVASNIGESSPPSTAAVAVSSADNRKHKGNGKKKRGKTSSEKKFTSLIVACLKRLIQIGINFFEGKEQELIQMAKQKFIDMKINGSEQANGSGKGGAKQQLAIAQSSAQSSQNPNEDSSLELSADQEAAVEDFIRLYMKSFEIATSDDNYAVNDAIDKETYQKTKWQRMLYRKISSKRHFLSGSPSLDPRTQVERIIEIAKVLFGLHMVEHPQVKSKGTWRKLISGQRKKAVMACFRMAPLHSIPHHRAINLFMKAYKSKWLEIAEENDKDISSLIPDLCPQLASSEKAEAPGKAEGEAGSEPSDEAKKEGGETGQAKAELVGETPDPLRQLITSFNTAATTEHVSGQGIQNLADDALYMAYADIMSSSCIIIDDDDDEEEGGGGGEEAPGEEEDQSNAFQEAEMQKQKLLFEQNRLADRGAAEMCLLYISASKGEKSEMLEKTLQLGISLLHGGNTGVQQRMLDHLKEKKDSGFFMSVAGLMANCSVLDLDTFERCIKAEQFGGVSSTGDSGSGMAGKKNLHDAEFTCSLFRFLQLLCEGHNLEFQNYLRTQPGNNTIVNSIICTVDYLLRLQESIMDFYWHYSGKSTVDAAGKDNFCKAINVAKQVFNSLTEYIQGPCVGNQLTLAHSRLWDAIGGFLYIFANLQDKLSKDPHQIELLRELMKLQKDMIIMLLSMLEGNVLNGPIGKQMVDTLIENQQNVEMLLKFFDIFLKMKDLTTSDAFKEFDTNGDGWISPKEFKKAMEAQKMYSNEEIDYILMCVDTNQDGKIDFKEFTERFHNPAKDIGFNMAVLLTNLSEHMSHDARLDRLMKKASSFLNYFEPFLGRIEITGSSGRIERVYFEIKESNIEQWNKPQIKESKRQFLYDIVNEGDDKEKLEVFVNFCEDTIFEMQHAASISPEEDESSSGSVDSPSANQSIVRSIFENLKSYVGAFFKMLSPTRIKNNYASFREMKKYDFLRTILHLNVQVVMFIFGLIFSLVSLFARSLFMMVSGGGGASKEAPVMVCEPEQHGAATTKQLGRKGPQRSFMEEYGDEEGETASKFKPFGLAGLDKHLNKSRDAEYSADEAETGLLEGSSAQIEVFDGSKGYEAQPGAKKPIKYAYEENEEENANLNANETASAASSSSSNYKKVLSMFARNFYKLKYLALILAFLINFFMLFYKARKLSTEGVDMTGGMGGEDDDEANLVEVIMMDPDEYYIEHFLKALAFIHSLVAFGMMVAYYVLKVPLVIFKREKEIARKLEFQGMWIAEQPSEDDLRSHWDKLVLNTRTYPEMYWDKFVKKKVKSKYAEQFDMEQLCKLLGVSADSDEYKFDSSKSQGGDADKAAESTSPLSK